jgi:hypothetical protein
MHQQKTSASIQTKATSRSLVKLMRQQKASTLFHRSRNSEQRAQRSEFTPQDAPRLLIVAVLLI